MELIFSGSADEFESIVNDHKLLLYSIVYSIALSEKVRETVMLYYFADKSIREISDILQIPEGTVKFRLSEGRKKLRKELMVTAVYAVFVADTVCVVCHR